MSSTDVQAAPTAEGIFAKMTGSAAAATASEEKVSAFDAVMPESARGKERFIPVTRFALLDRLTAPTAWPAGQGKEARRFFRYLDHWRRQQYSAQLNELEETYEPFSPDSDLLMTRAFTPDERAVMQARVIEGMTRILNQANYVRIDHNDVEQILTRESAYGLDLQVDLDVFEEVLLFYRGASSKRDNRRRWQKFYLREQFDIPLFQRLFLLFKLKPTEKRVLRADADEEAQPPRGREARQARARRHAAGGQGKLHLHEAVQEHPEKRSRDDLSQHARALPLFRQATAGCDRGRRPRPRPVRRCRQDRAAGDEPHRRARGASSASAASPSARA